MHCPCKRAALAAALLAILVSGCGASDDRPRLIVSAASSLTEAFSAYGEGLPEDVRFSFGGSDELAAQIRQGATPDVFASASTSYPEELAADGLVGEPVVFAANQLVLIVAPGEQTTTLGDLLLRRDVDLVIGAAGVPVGDYTREVIDRLGPQTAANVLANVRSEESDVKGVVGKVAQGAADAGFVYATDAAAAGDAVKTIRLPPNLEPRVAYSAAVVEGAVDPARAQAFIDGLLEGPGADELADAGFLPAPAAGSAGGG